MSNNRNGKIRVGVVGVGNWGRYGHLPVLQLLPDFEIVAAASRRKEYAEEIAQKFSIPHAYTDANELITHPEVDLVIVLPPAPQHAAFGQRECILSHRDGMIVARHEVPGDMRKIAPSQRDD